MYTGYALQLTRERIWQLACEVLAVSTDNNQWAPMVRGIVLSAAKERITTLLSDPGSHNILSRCGGRPLMFLCLRQFMDFLITRGYGLGLKDDPDPEVFMQHLVNVPSYAPCVGETPFYRQLIESYENNLPFDRSSDPAIPAWRSGMIQRQDFGGQSGLLPPPSTMPKTFEENFEQRPLANGLGEDRWRSPYGHGRYGGKSARLPNRFGGYSRGPNASDQRPAFE